MFTLGVLYQGHTVNLIHGTFLSDHVPI
uniref:Uncharacterized protein n=1 Tax=Anguilla anguilla TaxID=7936 RepID=A0A0E9W2J1_ANGAN